MQLIAGMLPPDQTRNALFQFRDKEAEQTNVILWRDLTQLQYRIALENACKPIVTKE